MIIGNAISVCDLRKKRNGTDADAQAFITASGISGTEATATNQLVIDLKAANIWTKMKCIYPFVGNTASSQKWNLKDARDLDAAFRLVFSGGGTFSANGYQGNGTNAFANTFLAPLSFYSTNMHLSYYSRTSAIGSVLEMGCAQIPGGGGTNYSMMSTARVAYFGQTTNGTVNYLSQVNSLGFFISQKLTNSSRKVFRNGIVNNSTSTTDSNNLPNTNAFINAFNDNGAAAFYSSKQCAFASIGDGLTDAEALAFYNAVQTFNTTLGRQV
jgi:hypothetical protein